MRIFNQREREIRSILLITPTRDRARSFRLCERWMAAQSRRDFEWIVVDDGDEPVTPTMGQIYLRREPSGAACTLQLNLLAALEVAQAMAPDAVLFIEDDDWYAPKYVQAMAHELTKARIAGEQRRFYYHLPTRGYLSCYNRKHAALASTAMRGHMIPAAIRACHASIADGRPYVDLWLWGVTEKLAPRHIRVEEIRMGQGQRLFPPRRLSVGIKGSPGRGGLGSGHDATPYQYFDHDGRVLRSWVGEIDSHAILALAPKPAVVHIAAP